MLTFIQNNRESTVLAAILLLFGFLAVMDSSYLSISTFFMVFNSAEILLLLAIGATFVILTKNIDVSVGSIMGLSAVVLGLSLNAELGLVISTVLAVLVGICAGLINGFLVTILKIPAIVATLGTLGLYRGLMLLGTGGKWIEGLPEGIKTLSVPFFLGISPLGYVVILFFCAALYLLSKTDLGRFFYATGDNLQAAKQLGVNTTGIRIGAFALNGFMAGIAGVVFASQIGFIPNQTGTGLEMKAIAACVLGGLSLLGGRGTVTGAILGAFLLTQIDSALVLLRLPAWWNDFIAGLILLAVLVFDGRLRVAIENNIRKQKYARFTNTP